MAAPPQTIALAGLILLNFVLAVAALCLHVLGRRRPRQQVPPPPLEAAAAGEAEEEEGGGEERPQNQRRRRRARRKRQQQEQEEEGAAAAAAEGGGHGADGDRDATAKAAGKEALLPRRPEFPLASVAGPLQRRINARYDDLARASEAQCLTIEQVNEFVNCLIDARNELLQRYENVQRSFKIKKAMLSNHRNYMSSYERLFEQVRRLETERDNLKKDAAIYNYIQERLQKSAAYKMEPASSGGGPPRRPRVLLAASGSVAAIKFEGLCRSVAEWADVRAVATASALHFIDGASFPNGVPLYTDDDEWSRWRRVGNEVLHIELRRWADALVIAPLSANTLAKVAGGLCDNLLTCVVRAWDYSKPVYVAPAMNTFMWDNPFTARHLAILRELGMSIVQPVTKRLACGDYGNGAMAEPSEICKTLMLFFGPQHL